MKSSLGLSIFVGVSLIVTLAPKLTIGQSRSFAPPNVNAAIAGFFAHHGYQVQSTPGEPIEANLGECRVHVLEVNLGGGTEDALNIPVSEDKDNSEDRIVFIFDGRTYPDQPTVRMVFQYVLTHAGLRLNIPVIWKPVLALRASPSCSVSELPWVEIARLP